MKLIKLKEVTEMTTLSKATIYRLMSKGEFPGVVRLARIQLRSAIPD
ncbi:AlpA family phage regulatory protein [Aeromonas veronii]